MSAPAGFALRDRHRCPTCWKGRLFGPEDTWYVCMHCGDEWHVEAIDTGDLEDGLTAGDRVYRYWDSGAMGAAQQNLTVVRVNRRTVTVSFDDGSTARIDPADLTMALRKPPTREEATRALWVWESMARYGPRSVDDIAVGLVTSKRDARRTFAILKDVHLIIEHTDDGMYMPRYDFHAQRGIARLRMVADGLIRLDRPEPS